MTTDERIEALTKAIEALTAATATRLDQLRTATDASIAGLDQLRSATDAAIAGLEQRSIAASIAAEQRATERARDMQTEIIRGIEAFARGNFSRMYRLETSDTATNTRIAALEERVLNLETRRPPQ